MSSDKTSSDISPDKIVETKIVPDLVDEMLKDLTKIPKTLTQTHMQQLGVYFGDTPVVAKRRELLTAIGNEFSRMIDDHVKSDHKQFPIYVHPSLLFYWSNPYMSSSGMFKELNPNTIPVIQWILKEYRERLSDEENEPVKRYLSALLSVNYEHFKPQRTNSSLIWGPEPNEKNVRIVAHEIAHEIAKPLKDFYETHLLKKDSPLLHLKCNNEQLKLKTQASLFEMGWADDMRKWCNIRGFFSF
ncbi:hypothetical protein RFI_38021 [Reticulomyxa filosa]|uniref:Uncharacterized protein n=1 Tax=Reticulomyxa filosa TaxID=46433 RepID=X6LFF4_RETFI|nr:hypothetical protein RFI_38021 [Reticulomyxa filosa]|eukprot:ETN99454.1 hypothetical protein RFI_38021 [Reticulomyxa filosa]